MPAKRRNQKQKISKRSRRNSTAIWKLKVEAVLISLDKDIVINQTKPQHQTLETEQQRESKDKEVERVLLAR